MIIIIAVIVLLLAIVSIVNATRTIDNFLAKPDHQRLQQIFADGLKSSDLQSVYYSVISSKAIPANEKANLCKKLEDLHSESKLNVSYYIGVVESVNKLFALFLGL